MDPIRVGAQMTETPTEPERISADEMAYHTVAVFELRVAQAVWQSWAGHLAQKYALAPDDAIGQDGVIRRAAPAGEA